MNDFLYFLNTAGVESLTKTVGMSRSVAENLTAARPFNTVEDCLKVRGMGKNLLARAQSAYDALETQPENRAMVPVEQEALPIEKGQFVEETTRDDKPSIGSRLGQAFLGFLRALLRLILLVILVVGVGGLIYYGAPYLREKFIAPVEQNAARVSELENKVADLQTQLTEINNQLTETNNEIAKTNSRIDEIKQSVEAHTASLKKLEEMQTTLEVQIKENNDKSLLALKHEVILTRAIDTLARARLYLAQSNFGLAKEDVQSAHDLLVELQNESKDEALTQAIKRLEMTLDNLPAFPVIASGDLEIAWQILVTGKAIPPTSTPEQTATSTLTSEPTLEATTTPTATP